MHLEWTDREERIRYLEDMLWQANAARDSYRAALRQAQYEADSLRAALRLEPQERCCILAVFDRSNENVQQCLVHGFGAVYESVVTASRT